MRIFLVSFFSSILYTFSLSAQDIYHAARMNNVGLMDSLYQSGVDLNAPNAMGYTPLILSVYGNHQEATAYLLAKKVDANVQDKSGNTALMGAAFKGYLPMVSLLLEHGADVNKVNYQDAPALVFAATFGHADIVQVLLSHGANKELRDSRGKSARDHALIQENSSLAKLLE